ncbi:MAG: hypothetical protein JW843_10890 [Candidatus Aminicenantes bacterium]|nr:hypothetical protein [Candidatus Aminicenantes bacterium]
MRRERKAAWVTMLAVAGLMSTAAILPAQTDPQVSSPASKPVRFFLGSNMTIGGDTLVKMYMRDDTEQTLKAGTLLDIKGGIIYDIAPNVFLRGSLGIHYGGLSARTNSDKEGTVAFSRFPLEIMVFFRATDRLSFGAGVRKAVGAVLKGSDAFSYFGSLDLESSMGLILEAEYRLKQWGIVVRYVSERYRSGSSGNWKDGGHIGLGALFHFK